ncbi:MAG: DMT family transporter [Burkholderiaceae bacterium]|jgi:drug/metabolite transporter (DMT)-like permease|nr:DMT family transporter [Burkholderiaceae bacterium]MCU0929653.1 DMT family transporter [Burkholderiaceae bacterium]
MNDATRGLALGGVGVVIFALTLPMTRLAVGDVAAPQLPPAFVTAGRAALAGLLSVVYLWAVRAPRPPRALAPALAVCALGTVVGFPLGLALALRQVDAMHAAVVTGVLPLATALVGALVLRQRASAGFWACSLLGCALVVGYAAWAGSGRLSAADGWLLVAVASAAVGYVAGARATAAMPAPQVICWVLVASLPLTLPATLAAWPDAPVRAAAWAGFVYVSLFSMWLGFFAWYRGLALGGVLRVSQVQLLQPFIALLAAWALLGEALRPATLWFTLAVVGVVAVGRRMPVGNPRSRGARR